MYRAAHQARCPGADVPTPGAQNGTWLLYQEERKEKQQRQWNRRLRGLKGLNCRDRQSAADWAEKRISPTGRICLIARTNPTSRSPPRKRRGEDDRVCSKQVRVNEALFAPYIGE